MKTIRHTLRLATLTTAVALALGGCYDHDKSTGSTLRILHINDHHSHLDAGSADLMLAGAETSVETGGFPRVVAMMKQLEATNPDNVLKLHAGDAVTGTLYYTLFNGEADAALMNEVCFDAFELGNHEFDNGDAGLKTFLDYLKSGSCDTSVLGANVAPEVGVSPLAMNSATDYIQPYVIKSVDGEQYGIVGIDIAGKTKNSSNPDASTLFLDETTTAQKYIDELEAQGVNRIIVMTHQGYDNDLVLAQNLKGVDVIVGGDSHSLLGEEFAALGLAPEGPYPTVGTSQEGEPVCIAQAWQYAAVVGELNVGFDRDGKVTDCSGTPHLLLGDTFERNDAELTGADLAAVQAAIAEIPQLDIVTPDTGASTTLAAYASQVDVLTQKVIGSAAENLCLARFPGDGRSTIEGCSELTKSRGSDISNVVAKAFLEMSNTSDICIQNGGGVRIDVPAGNITVATAYELLPFANTLTEIDMTGQQIVDVLEEAVDYALDANGSSGAYPYASGLRWNLDLSKPFGQRFSNVQINPRVAGNWQAISLNKTYKVVTNSYTAGGQDGYLTFGDIPDSQKVDTFLDYAKSFVDYVERETAAGNAISKLPVSEYSTQQFINADGELQ